MTQYEWKEIFSNNLVGILEERGMSQAQLARDSGLSVSRINDYIKCTAAPSIFAIVNLAYALDMEVSDLIDFGERIR